MAATAKQIANLIPPVKGERRNPKGRPKKLPDLDILMAEILGEEKDGKTAAMIILMALRAKASKGDIRAAEVLLNRGWGMPKQNITGEFTNKIIQVGYTDNLSEDSYTSSGAIEDIVEQKEVQHDLLRKEVR